MRRWLLYHSTHAAVTCSRSASRSSGPDLNGESSRTASVLYKPIVVSAKALSRASATLPTDGIRPAKNSSSPKRTLVYCDPESTRVDSGCRGLFVCDWADVADGAVAPIVVIETVAPVDDNGLGLGRGAEIVAR